MTAQSSERDLIVEGDCRMKPWPWQSNFGPAPTCERGVYGCYAHHSVREPGTRCRRHEGDGGHYTCPESDRVIFSCTNYAGRLDG